MRVVGGRLRGRNIASPASKDIRPTQDRLRESVFNILMHAYENPAVDARVLDLFAGTGALGIEAVSRGAAFALFVDNGAEARALLRNNVEALGLGEHINIEFADGRIAATTHDTSHGAPSPAKKPSKPAKAAASPETKKVQGDLF
jgi:16S rRNA (guanine(966)-N(2))-methyltransferase RsmD